MQNATSDQSELFVHQRLFPESTAYHIVGTLELARHFNPQELGDRLRSICQRHPSLSSRFIDDGTSILVSQITNHPPIVEHLHGVEDETAYLARREFARRPFDLGSGPLLRALIITRPPPKKHFMVIVVHHIVCDGYSLRLLMKEFFLSRQPGDIAPGMRPPNIPSTFRSTNCVLSSGKHALPTMPDCSFASQTTCNILNDMTGAGYGMRLSAAAVGRIVDCSQKSGLPRFRIFLAVWFALLARIMRQEEIVVKVPFVGRRTRLEFSTVGLFAKVIPIRIRMAESIRLVDLTTRISNEVETARGTLLPRSRPGDDRSQIMFNLLPRGLLGADIGLGWFNPLVDVIVDWNLYLQQDGESFVVCLKYRKAKYSKRVIEMVVNSYCCALERISMDATDTLDDICGIPVWLTPELFAMMDVKRPRTAKVQHAHLMEGTWDGNINGATPTRGLEDGLKLLVERYIGMYGVRPEDNLIELGIDSFAALRLLDAIWKEYGVSVGPAKLFKKPSIAALAVEIERLYRERRERGARIN